MQRSSPALIVAAVLLGAGPAAASTTTAVDKYSITPEEHAACDVDAARLCAYTYPDEDKLLACMRANHNQLEPVCLVALRAGLQRRHLRM